MSFVTIGKTENMAFAQRLTVAMSSEGSSVKSNGRQAIRAVIGHNIMRRLGWEIGQRTERLWGNGPDAGRVLLRLADKGPKLIGDSPNSRRAMVWISGLPRNPISGGGPETWQILLRSRGAEVTGFEIKGRELVIVVPRSWWLVSTPDSYAQPVAVLDRLTVRQRAALAELSPEARLRIAGERAA